MYRREGNLDLECKETPRADGAVRIDGRLGKGGISMPGAAYALPSFPIDTIVPTPYCTGRIPHAVGIPLPSPVP